LGAGTRIGRGPRFWAGYVQGARTITRTRTRATEENHWRELVFGAERFVGIEAGNQAGEHRYDPGEQFFARARVVSRDEPLSDRCVEAGGTFEC
jgi:hypothetical protein